MRAALVGYGKMGKLIQEHALNSTLKLAPLLIEIYHLKKTMGFYE